jgi:hypothetical protein
LAISLVLSFGSIAMAGALPGSGIAGSLHDLSAGAAGGVAIGQASETRICVFCHTPHHSARKTDMVQGTQINYYPLWNHALSTITSYQSYTNGSDLPNGLAEQLNADLSAGPGGVSKLCLSCHDGSVAVNSYGTFDNNPSPGAGGIFMPNAFKIGAGGDLSNHHPVGFNFAAVQGVDTGIFDASTSLLGGTGLTINDVLWNGNVECVSCHSVHNKGNEGFKFLWTYDGGGPAGTGSQICLSCHDK